MPDIIIIVIQRYPESNNDHHFIRMYVAARQTRHIEYLQIDRGAKARRIPKKISSCTLALPWHFTKHKFVPPATTRVFIKRNREHLSLVHDTQ